MIIFTTKIKTHKNKNKFDKNGKNVQITLYNIIISDIYIHILH